MRGSWVLWCSCSILPALASCADDDGEQGREHDWRGGGRGGGNGGIAGARAGAAGAISAAGAPNSSGMGGSPDDVGGSGAGGSALEPGPPEITALAPTAGPYGTRVTVSGQWLGSASRKGVQLVLGDAEEVTLDPSSTLGVESWTESEIVFRFPFPATGTILLTTPQGEAEAGDFLPSWVSALQIASSATASAVASISMAPSTITMLLDTTPPTLLELGPDGARENTVELGGAVLPSVQLYTGPNGLLEGVGVSEGESPELIHLQNVDGALVGSPTGITLDSTEHALAGGPDGAAAWMRRTTGWMRARPSKTGSWTLDKGPIADPQPNGKNRAAGATSDGSLYVAWAVDSGNFLDDMEAPMMRRLAPSDTAFGAQRSAGSSVDDYVTSLQLVSKGRGLIVRYCGSDVDATGLSGTAYRCFDGLHAQQGGSLGRVPVDITSSHHAFADARAVAGSCDSEKVFRLRTDTDVSTDPEEPLGEPIVYPCQSMLALEVDPDGQFVPVLRQGAILHLLVPSPP